MPLAGVTSITPVVELAFKTTPTAPEPPAGFVAVSPPVVPTYKIFPAVYEEVFTPVKIPEISATPSLPFVIEVVANPITGKVARFVATDFATVVLVVKPVA